MTAATSPPDAGRAFFVRFSDLDRWSPPEAGLIERDLPLGWKVVRLREVVRLVDARENVERSREYQLAGVRWYGEGVFHRETVSGTETSAKQLTPLLVGALVYNRLFAWKSSFAVVQPEHAGLYVSGEFPQFVADSERLLADFLFLFTTLPSTIEAVNDASVGSTAVSRNRFKEEEFLKLEMPLPPLAEQRATVERWRAAQAEIAATRARIERLDTSSRAELLKALGFAVPEIGVKPKVFAAHWRDLHTWSGTTTFKRLTNVDLRAGRFPVVLGRGVLREVLHGCSAAPSAIPTNLEVLKISAATRGEFAPSEKKFAPDLPRLREQFELRAGDLLLCRTNGTLAYVGMSALVPDDQPNLIFPDKLIRVRVETDKMRPDFLWLVLQTPPMRAQIEAAARTAVGNYAIGGRDVWNLEFPLPPLEVQRALVERVTAARAGIAREREGAARLEAQSKAEIEALILGKRLVSSRF